MSKPSYDDFLKKVREREEREAEEQRLLHVQVSRSAEGHWDVRADPLAADQDAEHRRLLETVNHIAQVAVPYTPANHVQALPIPKQGLTPLSVAIQKYLAYKSKPPVNKQEQTERTFNLKQFREWHEAHLIENYKTANKNGVDWPVIEVSKSVFAGYKDFLFERPYQPDSIEKKGTHIKAFFTWCSGNLHDWNDGKPNPISNQFTLTTSQKAAITKLSGYQPFNDTELKKIFGVDNYKEFNEARTPDWTKKPHNFFMPYLGLFTGARIAELARLEVSHFDVFEGYNGIFIPGTKVEGTSDTWIALHPILVQIGLLDYVSLLKKLGYTRLFPYTNKASKGYAKTASDAFQKYLKKLGIKPLLRTDPKKGFHSLRDTVNVTIQNSKIFRTDPELRKSFLRHKAQSINLKHYGATYAVHKLMDEVVPAINYDLDYLHYSEVLGSDIEIEQMILGLLKIHKNLKRSDGCLSHVIRSGSDAARGLRGRARTRRAARPNRPLR